MYKNKKISLMIIVILLIQIIVPIVMVAINNNLISIANATEDDIYDVILFWGQSNMLGTCGAKAGEKVYDERQDIDNFSEITGIDEEIVQNTVRMNHVNVNIVDNTALEYRYLSNELINISKDTEILGEILYFNQNNQKLEQGSGAVYSLARSTGTNMIPQFCKTYYEQTGRKVIAVFTANGGEAIQNFLPSTDEDYGDTNNQYIYEAMKEKYQAAIDCAINNNYIIGNKFYVCFQGETNASKITAKDEYIRIFEKVHERLKEDLGITKGVIIETARAIGGHEAEYKRMLEIYYAQEELAQRNDDIIIGSRYPWDNYVPDYETYKKYINNNITEEQYNIAFINASYSVCYPTDNAIHFTSAALSQIGKEAAIELAKYGIGQCAISHDYKEEIVAPTCTEEGYTKHTCTRCGDSYTDNETEALGHAYENGKCIRCGEDEPVVIVESEDLEIDNTNNTISKINTKTTVEDLEEELSTNATSIIVKDRDGKELSNEDKIGTNCKIILTNEYEERVFTLIVTGDVDGDGEAGFLDMIEINKHRLGISTLDAVSLIAGDINEDGRVDFFDLIEINKIRLGI